MKNTKFVISVKNLLSGCCVGRIPGQETVCFCSEWKNMELRAAFAFVLGSKSKVVQDNTAGCAKKTSYRRAAISVTLHCLLTAPEKATWNTTSFLNRVELRRSRAENKCCDLWVAKWTIRLNQTLFLQSYLLALARRRWMIARGEGGRLYPIIKRHGRLHPYVGVQLSPWGVYLPFRCTCHCSCMPLSPPFIETIVLVNHGLSSQFDNGVHGNTDPFTEAHVTSFQKLKSRAGGAWTKMECTKPTSRGAGTNSAELWSEHFTFSWKFRRSSL